MAFLWFLYHLRLFLQIPSSYLLYKSYLSLSYVVKTVKLNSSVITRKEGRLVVVDLHVPTLGTFRVNTNS
jgi:hypothetical protein